MVKNNLPTIAILGAGKLGVVIAQLALAAGYDVRVAGSGTPDKIHLSLSVLAPGAIAATSKEAIEAAEIVILALPLGKYRSLPVEALAGKLVIDAMNYWWEVDGDRDELLGDYPSSSEMIQAFLPTSRVVKAISHIGYHHLHDESRPQNDPERKAIAIAGDKETDLETVARFINAIGFDPLPIGPLSKGVLLEPGMPAFGAHTNRKTLRAMLS